MRTTPKPMKEPSIAPARTREERQAQLINAAEERAYQQIMDGTASSQVIVHYLRLADARERNNLEKEKLQEEINLLQARTKNYASLEDSKELLEKALTAFSEYRGTSDNEENIY